eukprot:6196178-Pleurochrysis_carterae.AAC.1
MKHSQSYRCRHQKAHAPEVCVLGVLGRGRARLCSYACRRVLEVRPVALSWSRASVAQVRA